MKALDDIPIGALPHPKHGLRIVFLVAGLIFGAQPAAFADISIEAGAYIITDPAPILTCNVFGTSRRIGSSNLGLGLQEVFRTVAPEGISGTLTLSTPDPVIWDLGFQIWDQLYNSCYDIYVNGVLGNGYDNHPFPGHDGSSYSWAFVMRPKKPLFVWKASNGSSGTSLPADGHSKIKPSKAESGIGDLSWAITGDALGCQINSTDGTITASNKTGTIVVLGSDGSTCYRTSIDLVPPDSKLDDCRPVIANLGSVDFKLDLGWSRKGNSAGFLQVYTTGPTGLLANPGQLRYDFLRSDVQKLVDSSNWIRQIRAPDFLANVVVSNSTSYRVELYSPTNIAAYTNAGLYRLTNNPHTTVYFENPSDTNRLKITYEREGTSSVFDYYWISNGWKLVTGNGLKTEIKTDVLSETNTLRSTVYTVQEGANPVVYQKSEKYRISAVYGERLIEEVAGTGATALTNSYTYTAGGYLQQVTRGDGTWEYFIYDSSNRPTNVFAGFQNQGVTTNSDLCRTISHSYSTGVISGSGDTGFLETTEPRQSIEYILGQEVSRRYYVAVPGERREILCVHPGAAWNNSSNLVTITTLFTNQPYANAIQRVLHPNGTKEILEYQEPEVWGTANYTNIVYSGHPDATGTNIDNGTKTLLIYDSVGKLLSKTVTDMASSIITASESYSYDGHRRLTSTTYLDGTSVQTAYQDCCSESSSTDREGTVTTFTHDALKRVATATRNSITLSNVYDAYGNILQTVRSGTNGSGITLNISAYDDAGRKTSSQDSLGNTTTFSETPSSGQWIKTTTYPNSSTRVATFYKDGTLQQLDGTGVHGVRFECGAEAAGSFTREVKLLSNGSDSSEIRTNFYDAVQRPCKTVFADGSSSQFFYNTNGLIKEIDPDGVTKLYRYDNLGRVETSALDLENAGTLDFNGSDRITATKRDVAAVDGVNVYRARTYQWPTFSSAASNLVSESRVSTDGLISWQVAYGLTNRVHTHYSGGHRYVTNTAPDGSYTISDFQNGYLLSSTRKDANNTQIGATTFGYDAHGRQSTITDARNGVTTYAFDDADRVTSVTTPSPTQVTTTSYNNMGWVTNVLQPDSASVRTVYHLTGEVATNSGARTYPVAHTYDYAGRHKTMKTWTSFSSGSGAATTTWNYDAYRGFLTNKTYADGSGTSYSNSPAGRLRTRIWARGVGTTNAYNALGDLVSAGYSGGSSNVGYGYDRRGRRIAITNGTDVTSLALNEAGQLLSEAYSGGALDGLAVTNVYDSLLRRVTNGVVNSGGAWLVQSTSSYDAASRLSVVAEGTNSATYAYLADSPLVSSITFKNGGTTRLTTTKTYDFLNRLTKITNSPSADSPLSFNYAYNSANQRTAVTNADSSRWSYQYDTLGQVTSGKKYWNDGTIVAGQQFEYAFDDIGNRVSAASGGDQYGSNLRYENYTANNLNQYTQRTVPGSLDVIGSATNTASVTVNNHSTYRKGDYFRNNYAVDNSTAPQYVSLTNIAVVNSGTNADTITTNTGSLFLPKTAETFTYDSDGNLTSDGRWTNRWDAENRLIEMEAISTVPDGAKQKLRFGYDSQWRRISKTVSNWNGAAWVIASKIRFVYDGWNLLAELNATNNAVVCSYLWGLDLSGKMRGAGGVGGLVAVVSTNAGAHFAQFDGNGNVAGLVSANGGTNSATYEYGPFGGLIRVSGSAATSPMRFSTKYQDQESDLLYYGYRYYSPGIGRWVSMDPIKETGGINLYGMVGNSPVKFIDLLGMEGLSAWDTFWLGSGNDFIALAGRIKESALVASDVTGQYLYQAFGGDLQNYVGQSQLYQGIASNPSAYQGVTFDSIAMEIPRAELAVLTFGISELGFTGYEAYADGDYKGLQNTFAGVVIGGALSHKTRSCPVRPPETKFGLQLRQAELDLRLIQNEQFEFDYVNDDLSGRLTTWETIPALFRNAFPGFSNGNLAAVAHANFEAALRDLYGTPDGDWFMRTAPGRTGVDATYVGPPSGSPGFTYGELKPYSQGSLGTFGNQLGNWDLPPGQTELFFYNKGGIIGSSGFRF